MSNFETQSAELIQNRHCRTGETKNEVSSIVLHKYNKCSFIFTFKCNLHLKNIFTLTKSPIFANLLIEQPGNWFTTAEQWENTWIRKKF